MLRHASPRGSPPGRCHAFVKTEADLGDLGADETWMSCLGPAGGDPDGQAANTGGGRERTHGKNSAIVESCFGEKLVSNGTSPIVGDSQEKGWVFVHSWWS